MYKNPYLIYHDLKVAAAATIINYKVGSSKYKEIDFFYKFATELLLRELIKLNVSLQGSADSEKKLDSEDDVFNKSEIEKQLSEDFKKISHNYNLSNGEVIVYTNKTEQVVPNAPSQYLVHQPEQEKKIVRQQLFTSLIGKSDIDTRKTIVPEPYQLSKVVASNKEITDNNQYFKALSQQSPRIPPPTNIPTQIIPGFFHPNWYTLESPKWLIYKQNFTRPPLESSLLHSGQNEANIIPKTNELVKTFAPTSDLRNCVLSVELRNSVWLNHMGLKEVESIKRKYIAKTEKENIDGKKGDYNDDTSSDETYDESSVKDKDVEMKDANSFELIGNEIKISNLIHYDPEVIKDFESFKKEKESLTKSPREIQRLISVALLKLNKLRHARFFSSSIKNLLAPSSEEINLSQRIQKLLSLLLDIKNSASGPLSIQFSKKIPVLLNEYAGTLPGGLPPSKSIAPPDAHGKSERLSGLKNSIKSSTRKRRQYMSHE